MDEEVKRDLPDVVYVVSSWMRRNAISFQACVGMDAAEEAVANRSPRCDPLVHRYVRYSLFAAAEAERNAAREEERLLRDRVGVVADALAPVYDPDLDGGGTMPPEVIAASTIKRLIADLDEERREHQATLAHAAKEREQLEATTAQLTSTRASLEETQAARDQLRLELEQALRQLRAWRDGV